MVTREFGKENKDVVILLHGGGLSWWNYREAAQILCRKYHVILPILAGHSGSDRDFTGIANSAREIIAYIDQAHGGRVTLIGGVSLGAQVLVEMLGLRSDICKFALIESALVIPMKLTYFFIKPMMQICYGLIKQPWFSKLQFKALKIKQELYDDYYRDTCGITRENIIAFLEANSCYEAPKELEASKVKAYIFVGQREQGKMIRSAQKLNRLLPGSELKIMKKRSHGEFSINCPVEYADQISKILKNNNFRIGER